MAEVLATTKDKMIGLNVQPVGNKILVLPDPIQDKTVRGIIIPESAQSQLQEGTVIKVSADVKLFIKEGERIVFPRACGVEQEYGGVKYKYLSGPTERESGDVWAII